MGLGLGLAVIDRYAMYLLSVRGWSTEVVSGSVLCTGQNQVQVEPGPGECCKCVPVVTSTSSLHILLCHWHFFAFNNRSHGTPWGTFNRKCT